MRGILTPETELPEQTYVQLVRDLFDTLRSNRHHGGVLQPLLGL